MSEEAGREAGESKEERPQDGENAPRAQLEEVESGPGGGLVRALRATRSAVAALMAGGECGEPQKSEQGLRRTEHPRCAGP